MNLVDQTSLKWVFVGGKGGVGKTTTSSSLAVEMSKHRKSVLLISTDPAHNLSDAFDQKFCGEPTKITGFENLFAMEIDPESKDGGNFLGAMGNGGETGMEGMTEEQQKQSESLFADIKNSIPGIDEATSFGQMLKGLDQYDFDLIIFDTAPTGHTLRLLNLPHILEKAIVKLIELKEKFGGMLTSMSGMMNQNGGQQIDPDVVHKKLFDAMDGMKKKTEQINAQFKDPERTTFVAVCIPEFLSMYETQRLSIELAKQDIDIRNIVVNQVLFPDPASNCKKCVARRKMQQKYIDQIKDMFDDFHITINPQLDEEVRGIELLKSFGKLLFEGYTPEWQK